MTVEERFMEIAAHCMCMGIHNVVLSGNDMSTVNDGLITKYRAISESKPPLITNLVFDTYRIGSVTFYLRKYDERS